MTRTMARKRVLYAAIHSWTSPIRVGSHAIASEFVKKGWEVAYIGAPLTPLNFVRRRSPQFLSRWREYRAGGGRDLEGKLWHYVPFSLMAPSNRPCLRSEWLFRQWQRLTVPDLVALVKRAGFGDVDLLFLDTIYQPFWLHSIGYNKCIVRLADFNAGFPGYGTGAEASERLAVSSADLVVTASAALTKWATSMGARESLYIPNGIDFQNFSQRPALVRPAEFESVDGPIAIFVGDIGAWVDLALITACALALPHVTFALVGPYGRHIDPDDFPKNVHFLGLKPRAEVPAYLAYANVGIIPFHSEQLLPLIEHINPLKLYEYLASGLPVIATRWKELEHLRSPATLCSSREAFIEELRTALTEPGKAERYRQFARSADWSIRLEPLFHWAT